MSRTAEQNRLEMEKASRDLSRGQETCRVEAKGVAKQKRELEESLAKARESQEGLERERNEMLRGFQDVRMDLEVSIRCHTTRLPPWVLVFRRRTVTAGEYVEMRGGRRVTSGLSSDDVRIVIFFHAAVGGM